MQFILSTILAGNVMVVLVYFLSFLIERNTDLGLLIWGFTQRRNKNMVHGFSNVAAILYFFINLIILQISLAFVDHIPEDYSFAKWFFLLLPLLIIFRMIHFELTPIDPDRDDYDFSD